MRKSRAHAQVNEFGSQRTRDSRDTRDSQAGLTARELERSYAKSSQRGEDQGAPEGAAP